ncbi:MAG: hypothetical protein J6Y91_04335 [Alphaproteobacteria bacterium]|nr:hypothetical protein [Alphaproteobacteria bacterium]
MKNLVKKIWDEVKQPAKFLTAVACFGLLPSSCRQESPDDERVTKDMLYYAQHDLPTEGEDMYKNSVQMKVVDIRVYDDATMTDKKGGKMYQMRWGIPAKNLPVAEADKTHAAYVFLDESSTAKGWVEVYENKYGISIVKDQPCFLVDKKGHLRLIGDSTNYEQNISKYYNELLELQSRLRSRAEQNRHDYYAHQTTGNTVLQEELEEDVSTMAADSTRNDTNTYVMPTDSVLRDSAEHIIVRDDSMLRKVKSADSLRIDTVTPEGR